MMGVMSRSEYITASSVSRFINQKLGAANPFTVQQRLYVEVLYNPKGSGIGNTLTRLMFALEQGGYMARYAPTGDRVLILGKRRA